jgi:hypothetical protein
MKTRSICLKTLLLIMSIVVLAFAVDSQRRYGC